ncbi:Wzz/FepE/Etk N-terminal domain-containing protein [Membranihabitans maritimus]|uniref:Wzz/FepE/Etk N-terminal domain-containing protein n=1 Tax=Membranihabitans maritimus TaxID=2904244 RepID=UPI001F02518D|nr:Wzz/FepE/Etk N-terminal domain-containing protein [Membranihabitans maritimus]
MENEKEVSFLPLGKILWHYRKLLLLTVFIATVAGAIISFLLPVYYQSTATIYPAEITYVESTDLIYRRGNITEFGDTEEAEQILELFGSQDFKMKIINSNQLFDHYNIKKDSKTSTHTILNKYNGLIRAERSRFNAVKISVKDQSPEMAAEIVNTIVEQLNLFRNKVIKKRIQSHYSAVQKTKDSLQNKFHLLKDSIFKLQEIGLVSQIERASLYEASGNVRGNQAAISEIISVNKKYGKKFDFIENEIEFIQSQIHTMDKILLQMKTNLAPNSSQQFIFEKGNVPDKKHSPKRSLVVLFTICISALIVVIYLVFRTWWPELKNRLET